MTCMVVLGTGAAGPASAHHVVARFVAERPMSATTIQNGPLRVQITDELKERV